MEILEGSLLRVNLEHPFKGVNMVKAGGKGYFFERGQVPQGEGRINPGDFARNGLSMGGVNKDLGGGTSGGVSQQLSAGKVDDGNPGRQETSGSSRKVTQTNWKNLPR